VDSMNSPARRHTALACSPAGSLFKVKRPIVGARVAPPINVCHWPLRCPVPATVSRKDLNIKAFPSNARDKDLAKFCSGEGALWYSGLCCDANPEIGPILPWVHQLLWLKVLRITNCQNAEGDIADICKWLVGLTHLELGATSPSIAAVSVVRRLTSTDSFLGANASRVSDDDEDAVAMRLHWIEGDISCLKMLKNLLVINLSMTTVEGDIGVLEGCLAVKSVKMQGCVNIRGSIAIFRWTKNLEVCMLGSTMVQGDIEAFRETTKLETLDLSLTKTKGSLDLLMRTPDLVSLNLKNTSCEGTIENAEYSPRLFSCILDGVRAITGSIKVFQHTPGLTLLGLSETSCYGDIRVFQFTPKVRVVRLAQGAAFKKTSSSKATVGNRIRPFEAPKATLDVHGSIEVFKWTPFLRVLSLHATSCNGDVKVFQQTPRIKYLNLNGTRVSGNVSVFQFTRMVTSVNLWRTQVHGDLGVFRMARHLVSLILAHSQVQGDIEALRFALPNCSTVLI